MYQGVDIGETYIVAHVYDLEGMTVSNSSSAASGNPNAQGMGPQLVRSFASETIAIPFQLTFPLASHTQLDERYVCGHFIIDIYLTSGISFYNFYCNYHLLILDNNNNLHARHKGGTDAVPLVSGVLFFLEIHLYFLVLSFHDRPLESGGQPAVDGTALYFAAGSGLYGCAAKVKGIDAKTKLVDLEVYGYPKVNNTYKKNLVKGSGRGICVMRVSVNVCISE